MIVTAEEYFEIHQKIMACFVSFNSVKARSHLVALADLELRSKCRD